MTVIMEIPMRPVQITVETAVLSVRVRMLMKFFMKILKFIMIPPVLPLSVTVPVAVSKYRGGQKQQSR
jgi:hypothetical protein